MTSTDVVVYGALVVAAVLVVLLAFHRTLAATGSARDEKQLRVFMATFVVVGGPLGMLGSRIASFLEYPVADWSRRLIADVLWRGGSHDLDAAFVLPVAALAVLAVVWRYRALEVLDAMFLCLPIGLAIGSLACLVVGCDWGRSVALDLARIHVRFDNPIPLYAIGVDLSIFSFLRRLYARTYVDPHTRERYAGAVTAAFLLLYGLGHAVLEAFRRDEGVLLGWTLRQVFMLTMVVIGAGLAWSTARRRLRVTYRADVEADATIVVEKLLSLLGLVASYLVFLVVMHALTVTWRLLPTPFHRADSLADAYGRIVGYLPVLTLPLLSIHFLRRIGHPIAGAFAWRRATPVFVLTLAVSLAYAIGLLGYGAPRLHGLAYWPAVVILSAMNAGAEETVHRLGILGLLRSAGYASWTALVVQSVLYSLVHFAISPAFGVLSFFYGLLLGGVMLRTGSVMLCIVCHFVIDLGGIGRPLLSY